MATFDEKEFLYDVYNSVKVLMSKKRALDEDSPEEWLVDFRKLSDLKRELASKKLEEINYEEALAFFIAIENKYKAMPDKWGRDAK